MSIHGSALCLWRNLYYPAGGSVAKRMNSTVTFLSNYQDHVTDSFAPSSQYNMCRVCKSEKTVTHIRPFLLFTWIFVFAFWAFRISEKCQHVGHLNHYKAVQTFVAANWWWPSCVKLVKDEKQVRANFICLDESNFGTLCDLLRPQWSQPWKGLLKFWVQWKCDNNVN